MTTRNKDGLPEIPRPPAPPADPPPTRPPPGPLSIAQVLGQMLLPELRPAEQIKSADRMDEIRTLVRDRGVGGFLLSGGDLFETPPLLNVLQQLSPVPLLIAADFENGTGQTIRGGTAFPTNLAVGATRSEELARLKGLITAIEARALGVHLNLAPVADLQRNPDNASVNTRAFGEDPALVARLATAFHLGCREKGLLTCAKHFPGHGEAVSDTPLSLPALRADREHLRARELVPFAELFRTGVDAVMMAHVLVEDVDRRYPASLSPVVVNDLLRHDMGFAGVVMTDAMAVGGLAAAFPPEEALILAATAGNDVLLHPGRPDLALDALAGAVRSGRLSEAALRASAQRLLDLKLRVGLRPGAPVRPELVERLVGTREHLAAAQRVADASITLVKDAAGTIPVSPRRFGPLFEIRIVDDSSTGNLEVFGEEMRRRFGIMTTLRVAPGQDTTPILLRLRDTVKARPKTALVIGVFSRQSPRRGAVLLDPTLASFVQAATRAIPNAAVVSFGNPYLLRQIPDVPAYVCGYSDCEATQRAAARVLCGDLPAAGKLPISLTEDYQVGHGLAAPKA
jgi:beta-N-acetylhexosaminidase